MRCVECCPCGETQTPKTSGSCRGKHTMCCYTGFEVSSQRMEEQTMRERRRVRITEKCVSGCERECLSLWIRAHTERSFVSSGCYLCAGRHFSFAFAQEDSWKRKSFLSFPHIDVHEQQTETNTHRHTVPTPSHPEANTCRHKHKYAQIHFQSHILTHTKLSAVLATSMGNNHALCKKQIENQW